MANRDINTKLPASIQTPVFLDFEQMKEWINYVVRSQNLAKYVISSCATFLTFLVTVSNISALDLETNWLYWIAFFLIIIATILSCYCLLSLMGIEAKLSERLVEDNADLDVAQNDFLETYFVRRAIAVSLALLFIGIALILLELSWTASQ